MVFRLSFPILCVSTSFDKTRVSTNSVTEFPLPEGPIIDVQKGTHPTNKPQTETELAHLLVEHKKLLELSEKENNSPLQ